MERKPGYKAANGSGESSRSKESGQKAFTPHYLQPSPATISVDASAFELLSRGASEEEARALRRFLTEWSRGDEDTFPFQFVLLTRAQMRAAAGVPLEMAKVLQQHQNITEDAARRIAQAAEAKLSEFAQLGKLAEELSACVQRLKNEGDAAVERLKEATKAHREAEQRAREASHRDDLLIVLSALLFVTLIAFLLGGISWRYAFLRGWMN